MCRLCLASTSHDTTLRLWDLGMLQDGAEAEEEPPQQQVLHWQPPKLDFCADVLVN